MLEITRNYKFIYYIMSSANKYTEVLAKYAKLCKDTLKALKSSSKASLTADPALYADFNNLVLKFNKYHN